MSLAWEVQKALVSKLKSHTNVVSKVTGIYDEKPARVAYPYIVMENMTAHNDDTYETKYKRLQCNISVFTRSDGQGWKPSQEITSEVYDSLHMADLSLNNGYRVDSCRWITDTPYRINDVRKVASWYEIIVMKGEI